MEHILYGSKEVPNIKISLMDNNKIIYSFENDTVKYFYHNFNTNEESIKITFTLMNPTDFAVLLSKKYDKYILESTMIWRNSQTYEDEEIESPTRVFTNFKISYEVSYKGDPIEWTMEFWNECNQVSR